MNGHSNKNFINRSKKKSKSKKREREHGSEQVDKQDIAKHGMLIS